MARGVQRLSGTCEADPKIISVGLGMCCGRTSLHHLFEACGIPLSHWRDGTKRNLTQAMMTIGLGQKTASTAFHHLLQPQRQARLAGRLDGAHARAEHADARRRPRRHRLQPRRRTPPTGPRSPTASSALRDELLAAGDAPILVSHENLRRRDAGQRRRGEALPEDRRHPRAARRAPRALRARASSSTPATWRLEKERLQPGGQDRRLRRHPRAFRGRDRRLRQLGRDARPGRGRGRRRQRRLLPPRRRARPDAPRPAAPRLCRPQRRRDRGARPAHPARERKPQPGQPRIHAPDQPGRAWRPSPG